MKRRYRRSFCFKVKALLQKRQVSAVHRQTDGGVCLIMGLGTYCVVPGTHTCSSCK